MSKKIVVLLCICTLIGAMITGVLSLSACTQGHEEESLRPMSEVTLDEHVLRWSAVEGATHYSLRVDFDAVNGYEIPVEGTEYILKLYNEGDYTLRVRPVFADGFGAYSAPITYTVATEVTVTPSEDGTVVLRGTGTATDPLLIYTREELASITEGMREEEENGKTVRKQNYYRLMADIDLSGAEWTSLGTSANPFSGIFDGGGHTISNLTQTKLMAGSLRRNGFFGTISKATIVNLTLAEVDIRIGLVTDDFSVGGLAGYSSACTVENCAVDGTIRVQSAQSGQKKCYAGMLIGYSNGTHIRRVSTAGTVDATYSSVWSGGIAGICTAPELDSLHDCLSRVTVKANGTGTKNNAPAGRAYAAGFAYLSNTDSVADCVWLGTAAATVAVGTPADEDLYGEGMFVVSKKKTLNGQCIIPLEDCYFDIDGLAYDTETYAAERYADAAERLAALADRYCVGGATSQKRTSSVYAVDAYTRGERSSYVQTSGGTTFGLDFDTSWQMTEDGPALAPYHSEWYLVRFVKKDGTEVSAQYVLKGQTATAPSVKGEEGYYIQWDFDAAMPITSDVTIYESQP